MLEGLIGKHMFAGKIYDLRTMLSNVSESFRFNNGTRTRTDPNLQALADEPF